MIPTQQELEHVAAQVGAALVQRRWRLVTVESCTGGWLGQVVTSVAASSQWYDGGFITYSNESKQTMLGVSAFILEQYGAVSESTVRAMADNAVHRSRGDISVAISGIAGPAGGTPDKPVGTMWLAWYTRNGISRAKCVHLSGEREAVRAQAVWRGLHGILELLGE